MSTFELPADLTIDEVIRMDPENCCEKCSGLLAGRVSRKQKRVVIFCKPCMRWSIIVEGKVMVDGGPIPEGTKL